MAPKMEYYRPQTLAEALAFLDDNQFTTHVLAGGTNLVVWMKQKAVRPQTLLDIKEIKELCQFQVDQSGLVTIGPLTTAREVIESCGYNKCLKNLRIAAEQLGSPVVRNRATIGGNLCAGSPAGDLSLALLSYDADLVLQSNKGQRKIKMSEFFKGPGLIDKAPNEILTAIKVSAISESCGEAYYKLGVRKSLQCCLVGIATFVSQVPDDLETIEHVTIALGAVAPVPMRAVRAESLLKGQKWDLDIIHEASEIAAQECSPISDIRASREYRRDMVSVLTKRMLCEAWEEACNKRNHHNVV